MAGQGVFQDTCRRILTVGKNRNLHTWREADWNRGKRTIDRNTRETKQLTNRLKKCADLQISGRLRTDNLL